MVHDAGPADAFPEGVVRLTRLGRHEVGVIRRGDRVFAVRNRCPHQAAPICAGPLRASVDSDGAGRFEYDSERVVLACPWHGWEFDVETGRAVWDAAYRVKTYAARIENGRVLVEIGGRENA